jgi:hypothetical protein
MAKRSLIFINLWILLGIATFPLQAQRAYGGGEWFKFRVHYGIVTAGYATLQVTEESLGGKQVFHVDGKGETTGVSRWFFPVEDYYESFIDRENDRPYRFIRNIDEGGHTKDIQIDFDHEKGLALVHNKKHKTKEFVPFPADAQDMVSAFYYLRNHLDVKNIDEGDTVEMNMFFDKENYRFKLKFLRREVIKTRFGNVRSLVFRPYVQADRVFKERESLTVWVSDDDNKIPLMIKADLVVGSLKASLEEFKGLKHPFEIIID